MVTVKPHISKLNVQPVFPVSHPVPCCNGMAQDNTMTEELMLCCSAGEEGSSFSINFHSARLFTLRCKRLEERFAKIEDSTPHSLMP